VKKKQVTRSYNLEIKFHEYRNLLGKMNIDSVFVLSCYKGSGCGLRATATNIKAIISRDTILIFDLCGDKCYDVIKIQV
jgi:hypothetical protein